MNVARRFRLAAPVLVAGLALAGCSGGGDEPEGEKSPSPSPTVVDGLTVPGLDLKFGEQATFEWQPTAKVTGELEVTVEQVTKATIKDFAGYELTKQMEASTPFFVEITAENTGTSDLGGRVLPIYLDTGGETLYPSVEIPHFEKCSPRALPEKFAAGASADLCLIFLAPAGTELRSIAVWPDGQFEQIDWMGEIVDPAGERASASTSPSSPSTSPSTNPSTTPTGTPSAE